MANFTETKETFPRVLILASGAGSTFVALAKAAAESKLSARIVGVIADRKAAVLERAAELQIEGILVEYRKGDAVWPTRLVAAVKSYRPDYIVLAGFLRKIPQEIVAEFKGRIFNSHPALLPKHGGPGMYGRKVHEAVIAAKDKESGVTLHHVTENYDEGGAVAQVRVTIDPHETAETLEKKIKGIEKEFLIIELQKIFSAHEARS